MTKKIIATCWAIVLSAGFVFILGVADANAQLHGEPLLSISQLADQFSTPEAIAKYMWRNFAFENDQSNFGTEEYWQTPEEFLKTHKGDCEDFALFAKTMLKKIGIKAFLLNIYGNGYGHTVCVFYQNGNYNVIDGTEVKRYAAQNLQELMSNLYPYWKSGAIVEMNAEGRDGRILKTITRD